jgi:hypothetical protein
MILGAMLAEGVSLRTVVHCPDDDLGEPISVTTPVIDCSLDLSAR